MTLQEHDVERVIDRMNNDNENRRHLRNSQIDPGSDVTYRLL